MTDSLQRHTLPHDLVGTLVQMLGCLLGTHTVPSTCGLVASWVQQDDTIRSLCPSE
jgi:hypothetical protein